MRFCLTLCAAMLVPAGAPASTPEGIPPDLLAECRDAVPTEILGAAEPGATRGSGEAGQWWIEAGDLDGDGAPEAVLVVLPAGRRGEVRFFAQKAGDGITRKRIKLGGGPLTEVSVRFEPFAPGRALAHIHGRSGGQALLDWDGKHLETIWRVGKTRPGERHWFTLEDLDEDGVSEISTYVQRELDVHFVDDEDPALSGGAANTEQTDLVAVYRWSEGRWRRDDRLLEGRR